MLTATLISILLTFLGSYVSADCPSGYTNLYDEKCYRISTNQLSWENARAFCQRDGGDLVSIHSQEENDAILHGIKDCCAFWTGLRCDNTTRTQYWSDGTPVDYTNFKDNDETCSPSKAYYFVSTNGQWEQDLMSDNGAYIICDFVGDSATTTGTTTARPSIGSGSECGLGYELLPDSTCVKITTKDTAWSDAEEECQQDGAHLASVHSKQSNDYIRRLALSSHITNAVFIGFQLENGTGIWQDGSDLDYTNFDPGMPNEIFGACGALQTGSLQGEWTSIFCDDSNRLPYACSKPLPCPTKNTFTVSGDFSSPEYPSSLSAGLYCEYFIGASPGSLVLLRFSEFQLVDGDQVILYDGEGDSEPLAVITSAAPSDRFMTKNLGVMRVVHLTGNGVGVRKWHANFVSF